MTANRLAYVVALTSDPSQISHPEGTEATVTPPHINTAPDGKAEGGGYGALLMVLVFILLVDILLVKSRLVEI
jgi:hypothetical protein